MRAATKSDACVIPLLGGRLHSRASPSPAATSGPALASHTYDLSPEGPPTPLPTEPARPAGRMRITTSGRTTRPQCGHGATRARITVRRGVHKFALAGAERNLDRHVAADGVRLMAFLSPFLELGQDPVALVAQLLAEGGGPHLEGAGVR